MTDKYITSSQYREGLNSIKEYIDKSIPHIRYSSIFTLSADKVLEIYNSNNHAMEFDKPINIDLNKEIIMTYNNEDILHGDSPSNFLSYKNDNISIIFHIGSDINQKNNENKMVITINSLNTNITSNLILKQGETKYLNNKYLKKDVAIQHSITIGTRLFDNIGQYSFSNGKETTASGDYSHAEGVNTQAVNANCHAEGCYSCASGSTSHAEGYWSSASGNYSHAEGSETTASGNYSHAEGNSTKASGESSHAEGNNTISSSESQHVQGRYNIEDTENKYAHIVGNGTASTRSNAHTLDWNGNAWFAGKLTQEGTPTDDKDLITKKYFDDNKPTVPTKTSELTNDSNFLTNIPDNYVTDEKLSSKGYLTEHQSLTKYATIEYVDSKLTTNYVSKEELTESTKPADTTTVKTTLNDILGGDYIE